MTIVTYINMIEKIKDFWNIFKNATNEFYKEKNEAIELCKRVKYLRSHTDAVLGKNGEILSYLNANISNYPKYMCSCINDLVSLFKYGCNSKTLKDKPSNLIYGSSLIYVLRDINFKCNVAYNSINEKFKKRNYAAIKEDYKKLIKDLKWYEKQYDMIVLDDYYEYDKI